MEFTERQTEQLDRIDNAVHELCKVMLDKEDLNWDMSLIGDIADAAAAILALKGWKVFYPAIVYNEDGTESHIEDYWPRGGIKK